MNLDHCSYRVPFGIRYNRTRFTFVKDVPAETTTPQYMNIVTEWTLEENTQLPAGLTLDSLTGRISGTPTEESELTTYTIYGSNPDGTASTTITIQVRVGQCAAEGVFGRMWVRWRRTSVRVREAMWERNNVHVCLEQRMVCGRRRAGIAFLWLRL